MVPHPVPSRPPSLRPPLSRLVGAGFLLAAVAGCGGDAGERALQALPEFCREVLPQVQAHLGGVAQPTGDRYGGTAVVGGSGVLAGGMNALVSTDYVANQHQVFIHLMTLLRFDEELRPQPWLARSWEVDPEGTGVVFHLRDDVRWHDGTPTTAHDVAFTYLRATDPRTGFPNAAYWAHYLPGEEGVEVLDDHTVRFRMRPHADALDPWRSTSVLPAHLLGDVAPESLREHPFGTRCPVGNGPFVFEDHGADGAWSFRRNPDFPQALGGPPYLERYVYRPIAEQTTLLTELLTGDLDLYIAPPPDQASRILATEGVELRDYPFRGYVFVGWNTRRPYLADARVRRALTLGTDRSQVVQAVLQGYGAVANAGVPPFHWAFHEGIRDALGHDPAAAGALLDEAGWGERGGDGIRRNGDGERLELSILYHPGSLQREGIAQFMQAQLREIGVDLRQEVLEWGTLVSRITNPATREFDGVIMSWATEFRVDDTDLFHSRAAETPFGWSGLRDERMDHLLDTLPLLTDRDEALPLWHEYQERLVELQPFTYFYFPRRLAGVGPRLEGVVTDVRGDLVNVAGWWVPAELRGRR